MALPVINVDITALAAAVNGVRPSGTFQKGHPFPAWAQMNSSGDIDVTGAPDQGGADKSRVSIEFTLDSGLGLTFPSNGFVAPEGNSDFGSPVLSNNNLTMTVSDTNSENRFTQLEYGLRFSDGSTLDPRMINR
jgi:hypothetical protein